MRVANVRMTAVLINRDRAGFTSVELLVAMGVMSLLAALFLPAVQRSRETSRRSQCVSHLRQLAIACQHHESAHRKFPYTATRMRMRDSHTPLNSISPHAALLPFLDRTELWQAIEFDHFADDRLGAPPASRKFDSTGAATNLPANEVALSANVAVFLCPSDKQVAAGNNYRACLGWGAGLFSPSPESLCPDPGNATGAFVAGRQVGASEFRDGLSQTALFSEAIIGDGAPDRYTPWADLFFDLSGAFCTAQDARTRCMQYAAADAAHDSYNGTTWLFGSQRHTWYNHVVGPNSAIPDCSSGGPEMSGGGHGSYGARSYHPGGVNLALGDGAVRFVSSAIDLETWRALSTRAGRDVASAF